MLLIAGFSLAIGVTFFFGYRAGRTARHIRWQNEPIRPWMSVPFIAHTRHVREEVLFQAIRVPANPHDHRPIRDIARAEKTPVAELIRSLQSAAERAGAEARPPSAKAP